MRHIMIASGSILNYFDVDDQYYKQICVQCLPNISDCDIQLKQTCDSLLSYNLDFDEIKIFAALTALLSSIYIIFYM